MSRILVTAALIGMAISAGKTCSWAQANPARAATAASDEVVVSGQPPRALLSQDAPVGPYNQPEWTTEPSFGTTRAYVRPPGQVEIVQFWTPEFSREGGIVTHAFRNEIEIGLPYRFQLDLYENWERNEAGHVRSTGQSVELRYAPANWGKIPLNPTLYGEWTFNTNAPDTLELKLLLAQIFAQRWHWAANVTYEQETGGARETEWQISQALSYPLLDRRLNAGVEMLFEHATERGSRGNPAIAFLIGPSINVRPTARTFINIAPLFGVTEDSPRAEIFVSAGIRFGGPAGPEAGVKAPASMFGR